MEEFEQVKHVYMQIAQQRPGVQISKSVHKERVHHFNTINFFVIWWVGWLFPSISSGKTESNVKNWI